MKTIIFRSILFSLFVGMITSCSPFFHQPFGARKAELGAETQLKRELLELPEPQEKLPLQYINSVIKLDNTKHRKLEQAGQPL